MYIKYSYDVLIHNKREDVSSKLIYRTSTALGS